MRGRKKSTKEANAEYLQKQGGTEVAEQKKQAGAGSEPVAEGAPGKTGRSAGKRKRSVQNRKI